MNQNSNGTKSRLNSAIPHVDRKLRMLEGTARVLSSNYDVTITFDTEGECRTHFDQMVLPYHELVDEALVMSLMGHEVGHLMGDVEINGEIHSGTDFSIGRTISRKRDIRNRILLFHIVNSLEDARIEFIIEELYPGFIDMFKRLTPYIKERKKDKLDELPEIQKILDVLYLLLRYQDPEIYSDQTVSFVYNFLMPTAERVHNCKNTRETLDVALDIYYILTKEKGEQMAQDMMKRNLEQQKNKCDTCNDDCSKCKKVPEFYKPNKSEQDNDDQHQNSKPCPKCGKPMGPSDKNDETDDSVDSSGNDDIQGTSQNGNDSLQESDGDESNGDKLGSSSQTSSDEKDDNDQEVKIPSKCDYCGSDDIRRFYVGQKIKHFRTGKVGEVIAVEEKNGKIKVDVEY